MPVSPLAPLSLSAEINLNRLRNSLEELKKNDDFYVDMGGWCCHSCALENAWQEGNGKPILFWDESCEQLLHKHPKEPMPIFFGIARKDASEAEICNIATKIIEVLEQDELSCRWVHGDINAPLLVHLDQHAPYPGDPLDEDEEPDSLEVAFYLQKNQDTEEYCWNESESEEEPEDTYYFYQKIKDGESVQDAYLEVDPIIRKYITHYERCATINSCLVIWDAVFPIDHAHGHRGTGDRLLDGLRIEEELICNPKNTISYVKEEHPFIMTFDLRGVKELLERGDSIGCQYIFLIKKIGICLYIRSTDHEAPDDNKYIAMTLAADGVNEDTLNIESDSFDQQRDLLYDKANPLYPGDLCEWLALDREMIDDCDVMLDKGFDKLRIVVDSVSLDLSRFSEQQQISLCSGGVFTHNRSIRRGGSCPLSELDCKMRFDYMKSKEGSNSAVPCLPSSKPKIHLDRKTLQSFNYS